MSAINHLHFTDEEMGSGRGGTLFKFTTASKSIPVLPPPKKAFGHKHYYLE